MTPKTEITAADIMDLEDYARTRKDWRRLMIQRKKDRRLAVGPNATMYFENFDTMLYQVHEMLYTERGGDEQLKDELEAYNPLIPKGNEIVATFMLEYEDPETRPTILAKLGGIEETISLEIDGEAVKADWEQEVERTTEEGKTSAIHFLHFRMTPEQADKFRRPDVRAVMAVGHPNYGHMAVIPEAVRKELAGDLE